MIFLLSGTERTLILREIDRLCADKQAEIINVDGSAKDFSIKSLMFDIENVSLFSEKKIIICKEPPFLISKSDDKDLDHLLNYCANPYYENDLIFYSSHGKFNNVLRAYKEIRKNAQEKVYEQLRPGEFFSRCLSELGNYKLDFTRGGKDLFIHNCNGSFDAFYNGIELLSLYPGKLDEQAVDALFPSDENPKIFELYDAIYNRNIKQAFKVKNDLLKTTTIAGLVAMMAGELRFIYYVDYLLRQGYRENDIVADTKAHSFRVSNAIRNSRKMNANKIIKMLNDLCNIDYQIKTDNLLEPELIFDYYLLSAMEVK